MKITEGYAPFGEYQTYFRIAGDLENTKIPLLLLHGGPGSTHNYFESFDELSETGRAIIMYDQIGCGKSSQISESETYDAKLWVNELENLVNFLHLEKFNLLGQSWGGMLAIIYATDISQEKINGLILSSTLSSASLWAQEEHRLIKLMPEDEQAAINQAEQANNFSGNNYEKANEHFMELHAAGPFTASDPEYLTRPKVSGTRSYNEAWGPNEYTPLGNLQNYEYTDKLKNISVPTLIMSGTNDLSTPLVAKTMHDAIPNSTWHLFAKSRHMPFIDEHELYMKKLTAWLEEQD